MQNSFRYGLVPTSDDQAYHSAANQTTTTQRGQVVHAAPSFTSFSMEEPLCKHIHVGHPNKELEATPSSAAPETPSKLSSLDCPSPGSPWAAVFTPEEWARATKDVPHSHVREPQVLSIG